MKIYCFLGVAFLSFSAVQAQGTMSAKSIPVLVNTLPFFEAKATTKATSEVVKGRTVWRETFVDNQHGWKTGKVKNGTFVLTPNGYQVQTEKREIDAMSLIDTPFDLNGSDFTLEASIESTGDAPPSVGILIGGDLDRFYVLQINYLWKFIVQYVLADKKPFTAEDFVFNPNIANSRNKLKITKSGATIDFYINDEKIQTRLFQPIAGQQIGLIGAGRNATFKQVLLIGSAK